jgi:hypothetical protein
VCRTRQVVPGSRLSREINRWLSRQTDTGAGDSSWSPEAIRVCEESTGTKELGDDQARRAGYTRRVTWWSYRGLFK